MGFICMTCLFAWGAFCLDRACRRQDCPDRRKKIKCDSFVTFARLPILGLSSLLTRSFPDEKKTGIPAVGRGFGPEGGFCHFALGGLGCDGE
jgi:hypothetical protein